MQKRLITITDRLEKQRQFRMRQYAERLVRDDTGELMKVYKQRAGIFGREWAEQIWILCRQIKKGESK